MNETTGLVNLPPQTKTGLFETFLCDHYASLERYPAFLRRIVADGMKRLFYDERIDRFLQEHRHEDAPSFIESIIEYFRIDIGVRKNELSHIPSYGRCVVVANHPLGALDAIALLSMLLEIRKDVYVIANRTLMHLENLSSLLIPVDNISDTISKSALQKVYSLLDNEAMVVVFPAGEVARNASGKLKDGPWKGGFYTIASKSHAPILPIVIEAQNSKRFYAISKLHPALASAQLLKEMFYSFDKTIHFRIGKMIPYESYARIPLQKREKVKLFQKHFKRLAKGKKPILKVQNGIATAQNPVSVRKALYESKRLMHLSNGMEIFLYESQTVSCVLKEIGRLREIAFRQVGEGTGKKRDTDKYDAYYKHIVVWDDADMEIVGAYRIGEGKEIVKRFGTEGFYSSELFTYDDAFVSIAKEGIELGRSFIHPKYWNSRALDYLWQGIGAYLKQHPDVRYLFGPVSLSASYTMHAKAMIVAFYQRYFGSSKPLATHKVRYKVPKEMRQYCDEIFCGSDYKADMRVLKEELAYMGFTVPTLYKHYAELCEYGGVRFEDFGYDKDFGYCVDGFVIVDLHRLKPSKRRRYLED